MNSLRYQFNVCIILIGGISAFYLYKIYTIGGGWEDLQAKFIKSDFPKILIWQFPIFVSLYYIRSLALTWARRHISYRDFVAESPGPGMVSDVTYLRDVDFKIVGNDPGFSNGAALQAKTMKLLQKRVRFAEVIKTWNWRLFWIAVLLLLIIDLERAKFFL